LVEMTVKVDAGKIVRVIGVDAGALVR